MTNPTHPVVSFTLSPAEVFLDIEVFTCSRCGGENVEMREDRDDASGYHAEVLYCTDCQERAD